MPLSNVKKNELAITAQEIIEQKHVLKRLTRKSYNMTFTQRVIKRGH